MSFLRQGGWALITGASSGIGAEFARQLHEAGLKVALVARRVELLESIAAEFNATREASAKVIAVDLASRASDGWDTLLRFIDETPIEILVNNAGRGSFGRFEKLSLEDELGMVALNVEATLRLAHRVIPGMKERRHGAILSVSSVAGFQPLPFMGTYAATKAFNLSHSVGLRYELAPFGVRVVALCPGPVATEFAGVARIPGKMTGVARDPVQDVVGSALNALERNKPFVVPCIRAKLLWWIQQRFPLGVSTWLTGRVLNSTLNYVERGEGASR